MKALFYSIREIFKSGGARSDYVERLNDLIKDTEAVRQRAERGEGLQEPNAPAYVFSNSEVERIFLISYFLTFFLEVS